MDPTPQSPDVYNEPWVALREKLTDPTADAIEPYLAQLTVADQCLALSRLDEAEQRTVLAAIAPLRASALLGAMSPTQAAKLLEVLEPREAAVIVDGLRADQRADLLSQLDEPDRNAILDEMAPDQADEARRLTEYAPDCAGGIMGTDYLAFPRHLTTDQLLAALREYAQQYADYQVQYIYVTDGRGKLIGVMRMRDVIFAAEHRPLDQVMIRNPIHVRDDTTLDELRELFDSQKFLGIPVTDPDGRLVGIVSREEVEEARRRRANSIYLKISGIIGGEEFRSMPLHVRSGRRLSWLSINILLNLVSASVIAMYQDTLEAAISLAVFLPIISDMSGCSGNQAVAVSMRELSIGLVRPTELLRVFAKEFAVGIINGIALGAILSGVALLWKGNPYLGLVVAVALAVNNVIAVCVGGMLPLITKRLKLDPALVSGPMLTTITDMCGFFLVLSLASTMLNKLATP